MEVKCGSQPFLVLHHFIMSKHITAKHHTVSITSKNDEMIALSESSLAWIFFARLRKQTVPNNLQGPHKNGWALETRLSGFMFLKNSEKSNRSNDQLPQSKCLQRWHRLAILVPGLGTNRLPTYDTVDVGRDVAWKKVVMIFWGVWNKISGLNFKLKQVAWEKKVFRKNMSPHITTSTFKGAPKWLSKGLNSPSLRV